MANKEIVNNLLADIKELEKQLVDMQDTSFYPVSFFSQTFSIAHKILTDLHALESNQFESLQRQIEEHRKIILTLPLSKPVEMPQPEMATTEVPIEIVTPAAEESVLMVEEVIPIIETIREETLEKEIEEQVTIAAEEQQEAKQQSRTTAIEKKTPLFLSEILEKKNLSDFRKALSLNDRFRFRRELFNGDEERMNRAMADLNEICSYEESIKYLRFVLKWEMENEAVAAFSQLIEKRFL